MSDEPSEPKEDQRARILRKSNILVRPSGTSEEWWEGYTAGYEKMRAIVAEEDQ